MKKTSTTTAPTQARRQELLGILRARFEENLPRHPGTRWDGVQARLEADPEKLAVLDRMETSGGEPDVVALDGDAGILQFADCSPQSPKGRRSLCFDEAALAARKANKPSGSAVAAAAAMGIELLTEEQYRRLQQLGEFDTTTSSWVRTPPEIRQLGGALFCDRRFGKVFVYHNGAESYYAARGFRGVLTV